MYHILNWLYVLLQNRKFRMDGDIALQAKAYIDGNAFLNNTISISQLEKAMVLGKLGEQIVAMSEKAFSALKFKEATPAQKEIYHPKKLARDTAARNEFRKEKKKGNAITEKYILDLMREWCSYMNDILELRP